MESLINYLAFENKSKMMDQLPCQQQITDCKFNFIGLVMQLNKFLEKSLLFSVCIYLGLMFSKVIKKIIYD